MAEADTVQPLKVPEPALPVMEGLAELRVPVKNLPGPPVEVEIDRPLAEMLEELFVLVLVLLPAGRHSGDAATDPELAQGVAYCRPQTLRPEQGDRSGKTYRFRFHETGL